MRLLFDEMLEKTARWARLFGVDSEIAKGNDTIVLALAGSSRRILITRDRQLAARCKKKGIRCFLIKSTDLATQLCEIERIGGQKLFSFPKKTRCPLCNAKLGTIKKQKITTFIPPLVYHSHRKFWLCEKCRKIYWQGGHWNNINKIYTRLKKERKTFVSGSGYAGRRRLLAVSWI